MTESAKNPHAVALGRKSRGIPRRVSPAERLRRQQQAALARAALAEKRAQTKIVLDENQTPVTLG